MTVKWPQSSNYKHMMQLVAGDITEGSIKCVSYMAQGNQHRETINAKFKTCSLDCTAGVKWVGLTLAIQEQPLI